MIALQAKVLTYGCQSVSKLALKYICKSHFYHKCNENVKNNTDCEKVWLMISYLKMANFRALKLFDPVKRRIQINCSWNMGIYKF